MFSSQINKKFLVHITCGPDNPTKAALGFLVAKTALAEGHSVSLFLAAKARGMTEADLQGKAAEFAMPTKLVQLAGDSFSINAQATTRPLSRRPENSRS